MPESMLLLAIDTCGPTGSVALGQLVSGEVHILGETSLGGQRPSETVVASACEMLRMAEVQLLKLSAIVAVNGPGSIYRRARGVGRREGAGRIGADPGGRGFAAGGAGQ